MPVWSGRAGLLLGFPGEGTSVTALLAVPEWTIWTTDWFVNSLLVLTCSGLMPSSFALRRQRRCAAAVAAP